MTLYPAVLTSGVDIILTAHHAMPKDKGKARLGAALTLGAIVSTESTQAHEINIPQLISALTETIMNCAQFKDTRQNKQAKRIFKTHSPFCYAEHVLRNGDFHLHFRMTRTTFEVLLELVVTNAGDKSVMQIPWHKQLMIGLWVLATPDSFRSIGETFSCNNKSTVHDCYLRVIHILSKMAANYIAWPSREDICRHQSYLHQKSGFPGIVGFIDGSYINIKAPANPVRYFNRKKDAALILQAVCDRSLKFIDVYFGEVGSLHDARVYSRSPIAAAINAREEQMLPNDGHLLGDSAYVLTTKMMTPYRDNGHLLDEEIRYNHVHAGLRGAAIERAFGLLKAKWRRLKYLDMDIMDYMARHVLACCVLHNFVIISRDMFALQGDIEHEENDIETVRDPPDRAAHRKRNNIAVEVYYRDLYNTEE